MFQIFHKYFLYFCSMTTAKEEEVVVEGEEEVVEEDFVDVVVMVFVIVNLEEVGLMYLYILAVNNLELNLLYSLCFGLTS